MKKFTLITAAIFAASSASAQDMNFGLSDYQVGAGLSSLGAYVEGSAGVSNNLRVRGTVYRAGYEDKVKIDESGVKTDVDADFDATSAHIMGDYYLGGLGFRLSGGLSVGGYELTGKTREATFDGDRFFNSDNSEFSVGIKQKNNVAPVAALGYARSFGKKKQWGVSAEIGTRFTSFEIKPGSIDNITSDRANTAIATINSTAQQAIDNIDLTGLTGQALADAQQDITNLRDGALRDVEIERNKAKAEFNKEIDKLNNDLEDFGLVPFLSVGVTFNF